jgi:hypothetical protein
VKVKTRKIVAIQIMHTSMSRLSTQISQTHARDATTITTERPLPRANQTKNNETYSSPRGISSLLPFFFHVQPSPYCHAFHSFYAA